VYVRRLAIAILGLGLAAFGTSCGASGATAPAATTSTKATATLPVVDVARTAACQQEAMTIAAAESMWSTLHDGLASLEQLVAEQFLRARPTYYGAIRAGVPAGGYTLVGVPGECGDWPVAYAGH
jgi:hypothetical protein